MIKSTKKAQIERKWHLIDAKGKVLGRLSTQIVPLLLGKSKSYFVRNLDCGDHVVVINASEVVVTGKKETDKYYYHYSGYPGGLKKTSVSELRAVHPERIILAAVSNMLPKNKLRQEWLNKLHVFAEGKHTFEDKFKKAKKVEEKK